jgi:cysteine-rich repeat protein
MRTPPVAVAALLLALSGCSGSSDASAPVSVCGDADRSGSEQCDDGNLVNLDGCDASCRFEQVLRANHLALEFAPTATCTANAFGGAVTAPIAQQAFTVWNDDAVRSGYVGWLLWLRDLDDLSGVSDAAVEVGVLSAGLHPASMIAFDSSAARDSWFLTDPRTVDADRLPHAGLQGALAGGVLAAGPGRMPLPLALLNELALLDVVDARISFEATGLTTPALSSGEPPGHLPSEHLSGALRTFASAGGGELCGAVVARSLAAVPMPSDLIVECGYSYEHSFLDLLVGGCGVLSAPTQPDRVNPEAPALGAGGPYHLVFDDGARAVTACQDAEGVLVDLEGCLDAAAYSSAFTFTAERAIVRPGCGDASVGSDEECDNGNTAGSDGCSRSCTVEEGWTCSGDPSVCTTPCGDGILDLGETCDDGNRRDLDGCWSTCDVEDGYTCSGAPSVCSTLCGDGVVAGTESCDDLNGWDGDGCSATCTTEPGFYCSDAPSFCITFCGDGEVAGPEQCDDGDTWGGGDGCAACVVEAGWTCEGSPSVCTNFCLTCDDAVACTADACDGQSLTCEHVAQDALCEDGESCTVDACDPISGCVQAPVPDATSCAVVGGGPGSCQSGVCVPL